MSNKWIQTKHLSTSSTTTKFPIDQSFHDDVLSFQLRTQLSHLDFSRYLWPIMRTLGWKTNNVEYWTPTGILLGNSKMIIDILDTFNLKSVKLLGNSFIYKETLALLNTDEEKTLKEDRNKLLERVFYSIYNKNFSNSDCETIEDIFYSHYSNHDCLNQRSLFDLCKNNDKDEEISFESRSLKTASFNSYNKNINATVNEPGAEKYFRNKRLPKTSRNIREVNSTRWSVAKIVDNTLEQHICHTISSNQKIKKVEEKEKNNINKISHNISNDLKRTIIYNSNKLTWLTPEECVEAIRKQHIDDKRKEQNKIDDNMLTLEEERYKLDFPLWSFLLSTHHSILFYGFGSKRRLLNYYSQIDLKYRGEVLTLNGYDNDINIDEILDIIVKLYLRGEEPPSPPSPEEIGFIINDDSPTGDHIRDEGINGLYSSNRCHMSFISMIRISPIIKRAISISKALTQNCARPLYIVIHNIDRIGLKSQVALDALASLVVHSNYKICPKGNDHFRNLRSVMLVASVDDANAGALLWELDTMNDFSWCWKLVNTYRPYFEEVTDGIIDTNRKIQKRRMSSLNAAYVDRVLKSIAPRHTEILIELAKLQIEHNQTTQPSVQMSTFVFVYYVQLKEICSQNMVISKEADLRSMLKELIDHGLVLTKKHEETHDEMVGIPTNIMKLHQIINIGKMTESI